jgi:3-deoxy-D-manno-octulosonic acid kinase
MKYPQSDLRKPKTLTAAVDSYRFGLALHLTETQLRILTGFFRQPEIADKSLPGGRAWVGVQQVDGIGTIAIKHYHRGGLMRYIVKRHYFRFGKTRAQREFELLHRAGHIGINVPQPVAYAYHGRLFYLAWLVTRKIRQAVSLARLSLENEESAREAMLSTIDQISILIQNGILHVDMHPGNVEVDTGGKVYLLDFDRGRNYRGSKAKLTLRYLARWRRAVLKHRLPNFLAEMMQEGLRSGLPL